ncbi:MAG TPA: twin-arginine translocase subunit TatC [Solirubrobacterales bacterium]|nr:twin-arginine translocase subunit TatC [Solirubrobacterales bacterium]
MARLKPVSHEDRLTLVEHLDELRTRIIVCVAVLVVAMSLCVWQNERLLDIADDPVPREIIRSGGLITLGPAEAFTTTLTVSAYFAILLALPIILYQLYAYILPAFSDAERRVLTPLLLLAPLLFIGGVVFAYFVLMPPAIDFLVNFNDDTFNNQLRAREYYTFFATMLIAMGLLFELPLAILAITRLGIVTPDQLAANRRYAIMVIAVLAALLPTIDPVTLLLEMVPIILLFELSILLARAFGRPGTGGITEPSAQEH